MKQLFLGVVFISVLAITSPVGAQQSINVGTPASDLQQNVGSEYFQRNNTGGQPAGNITENAGGAVLQNTPSQPLDVSGAPANSATTQEPESGLRWLLFFGLFLLVLLSPALLFRRDMQKSGDLNSADSKVAAKPTPKKASATQLETVATPSTSSKKQATKTTKKSKKTTKKVKRGKKKK